MFKTAVWCALVLLVPPPQEQGEKKPEQGEQQVQGEHQQAEAGKPQAPVESRYERDTYKTARGDLTVTCIGHGTLMFQFEGKVVHVDPVGRYGDYGKMPKADLILVTHEHGDHLDMDSIEKISTEDTELILTKTCFEKTKKGTVMKNGEQRVVQEIKIEAVPAYNLVNKRSDGTPFHPRGVGNGYVITFGDKRVYVAGDTENTPEMKKLQGLDIAFLPMNLPYTMTPEMVADAALAVKPKVLYPYHFGKTDTSRLVDLLKDHKEIQVKIRKFQ